MRTEAVRAGLVLVAGLVLTASPTLAQSAEARADSVGGVAGEPGSMAEPARDDGNEGGPSLLLINPDTRVRSVDFRFTHTRSLEESRLAGSIGLRDPGPLLGLRRALDVLPFVSGPTLDEFTPLALQKDLARLRRRYREAGFPEADLDYRVRLDTAENVVDVAFLIEEGRPVRLGQVSVVDTLNRTPDTWLPGELAERWPRGLETRAGRGIRYSESETVRLENEVTSWFQARGYPWARGQVVRADTAAGGIAAVTVAIRPGPRARVDSLIVEGNRALSRETLLREIPLEPGEWYDAGKVADGEREIFGLELIRRALVGVVSEQPRDGTVTLRVRVDEGLPRLVWGRAGYRSDGGVAAEAHWIHRSFPSGARTFTASVVGETGWLAVEPVPVRSLGGSAVLRIPYFLHRRISATVGPFAEYDVGVQDESFRYGLDATLLYQVGPLQSLSLRYELSRRAVEDALPLASLRQVVDDGVPSLDPIFTKSVLQLSGSYGRLDDPRAPESGWVAKAEISATPPLLADVEYARLGMQLFGAQPVGSHLVLVGRATAGRLFPWGRGNPSPGRSPQFTFAGLRDVLFSAGGVRDVRGWSSDLMGPKVPRVALRADGTPVSDRYAPVGGLARATVTGEILLPFPFLDDPHRTYLFLDGGRIWSPDDRFEPGDQVLVQDGWYWGTGGGVQISTPVGPVRFGVGYKLNPSATDLREAGAVLGAILSGTPLGQVRADQGRRWVLHLSLGRVL